MGTRISVVVPLLNEEANIGPLHQELVSAMDDTGNYEIVYVDDGSTDSTFEYLSQIATETRRVKVVRLRRNFGQTAALSAGVAVSEGDIVVFMDGDRQNDPGDIPLLISEIDGGYDVVSGWRKNRKDKFFSRRVPSMIANRMISSVTGVRLHDYGCTLKAYRREVLEHIELYGEMHRFIPVFASWVGSSLKEVVVNHRPRTAGTSKYGISRTFKVLFDLLTVKFLSAYSTKPIYVFGAAGLISGFAALIAVGIAAYQKLVDDIFIHRNPLFTIAIFLGVLATQFLLMGLIAELAIRTYHESQNKPIYVVRESINLHDSSGMADA